MSAFIEPIDRANLNNNNSIFVEGRFLFWNFTVALAKITDILLFFLIH